MNASGQQETAFITGVHSLNPPSRLAHARVHLLRRELEQENFALKLSFVKGTVSVESGNGLIAEDEVCHIGNFVLLPMARYHELIQG